MNIPPNTFTDTQLRVIALSAKGKVNKQIAVEMGITESSVASHQHNILKKAKQFGFSRARVLMDMNGNVLRLGDDA